MTVGVKITGVGMVVPGIHGVPGELVTNAMIQERMNARALELANQKNLTVESREEFIKNFSTTDAWIQERTGIRERHIIDTRMATDDLATLVVEELLYSSGVTRSAVRGLHLGTVTPSYFTTPPTVALIQHAAGFKTQNEHGLITLFGGDKTAACSSFIVALQDGVAGVMSRICDGPTIVIGADTLTRFVDQDDRSMCILFGDAAAGLMLEPCDPCESSFTPQDFCFGMNGQFAEEIIMRLGGSRNPMTPEGIARRECYLTMNGKSVFKKIVPLIFNSEDMMRQEKLSVIGRALHRAGKKLSDIDIFFFHQANLRMIEPIEKKMRTAGMRKDAIVFNNIDRYGNTTSATIPLLMAEAHAQGKLNYGNTFMAVVFGGGFTWGSVIGRWTVNEPL